MNDATSSPPPIPVAPSNASASGVTLQSGDQKFLRLLVVPGLGLLGACFAVYVGGALITGLDSIRSDYNQFSSEYPLLAPLVGGYFQAQGADKAAAQLESGALILVICGVVGALASILFFAHRYSKLLAMVLILCGVGPLLQQEWEFFGLPMAVGGVLGLMVRDKKKASSEELASSMCQKSLNSS